MSTSADNLKKALSHFDLSEDESSVYLHLLKNGRSSALVLSRQLGIARTKIYRILSKLVSRGLVIEEVKGYGTKYLAESYEKLKEVIEEREGELMALKSLAPELFEQLSMLAVAKKGEYKILHYRGLQGLEQVTWNTTKAKGEFRIYEISNMNSFLDYNFAEKVRKRFLDNKIQIKQLTNLKSISNYSSLEGIDNITEIRYINENLLNIVFEVAIYNDTFVMYTYENEEIFCVEIINPILAEMQKQVFDIVWAQARQIG